MTEISPQAFQEAVANGFKRNERAQRLRLHLLRKYVGQYYDREQGESGREPLNLIYNAIRVLVPNLVFNYPEYKITTEILAYREYAELRSMGLLQEAKKLKLRETYRACVVDAIFMMGIIKTGICSSDSAIHFEEDDVIDPGMVYSDRVSFGNFVWDPSARDIDEGLFQGDRIIVPRGSLLESGLYNNDLIEKLPPAYSGTKDSPNYRAEALSAGGIDLEEVGRTEDLVEIVELWVPRANALITVPAASEYKPDDYLRITDYEGPDTGPYTRLVLTPPVPDNPMPISAVGIWADLHTKANEMASKVIDQAIRQKDIVAYKPSAADDAAELQDAGDGEAVAVDDPEAIRTLSFGGQKNSNEAHLQTLQGWFNMMSGNTEGLAGMSMNAKSATEAQYLSTNAQVTLGDMQDLVYHFVAAEARNRLWYAHTDPLMEQPLVIRRQTPPAMEMAPNGMPVMMGGDYEDVQVVLTPEMRRGDFVDFAMEVEPQSMGRETEEDRYNKALEFAVRVVPAAAQAAMVSMQMGTPFSFPRFVARMAKMAGIKWIDEVFSDPALMQQMMVRQMMGPQFEDSKGQLGSPGGGLGGIMQNGGSTMAGAGMPGGQQQMRSDAQQGSAQSQADLNVREV